MFVIPIITDAEVRWLSKETISSLNDNPDLVLTAYALCDTEKEVVEVTHCLASLSNFYKETVAEYRCPVGKYAVMFMSEKYGVNKIKLIFYQKAINCCEIYFIVN